jgi:hypothetical protein
MVGCCGEVESWIGQKRLQDRMHGGAVCAVLKEGAGEPNGEDLRSAPSIRSLGAETLLDNLPLT